MALQEVVYDIKSGKALTKKGYIYGVVLDVTNWNEAAEQARQLEKKM